MQNLQEIDAMTPQRGGAREGAGRPKGSTGPVRKPVSFTLYEEERETLKAQAAALGKLAWIGLAATGVTLVTALMVRRHLSGSDTSAMARPW